MTEPGKVLLLHKHEEKMSEEQNKPPSPRAEVEQYQRAIDFVRQLPDIFQFAGSARALTMTVVALAQERVAELSRRAEAAEQDEIAWRGGP